MAPKKSTRGRKRQEKVDTTIKAEPRASSVPVSRKDMINKLKDQKAYFSQTIQRRKQNLRSLNRAVAALKIHLGTLQDVATSNNNLIAEVEEDMRFKDDPSADGSDEDNRKEMKNRATSSRAKRNSGQQIQSTQA
ncbi:hypothetical protein N7457_000617 [Penicillium paradoxum]|uniref:uncharacterized protein n=1 Tax=Penicillium paradoxum TaxID=176176 RepID=UPI002549B4A3|nr:uncharacterized protein N7457_000617 [Penicillium paradoxum]KAJ5794018.1 hypothetical protein N7457_000617 [Penicillium paradoxum]